jgi:hypothetical protein
VGAMKPNQIRKYGLITQMDRGICPNQLIILSPKNLNHTSIIDLAEFCCKPLGANAIFGKV